MGTLTGDLRERTRAAMACCPVCLQPTKSGGARALAASIGIPHTVLWRFLRGGDITGRNLDKIAAWLDPAR